MPSSKLLNRNAHREAIHVVDHSHPVSTGRPKSLRIAGWERVVDRLRRLGRPPRQSLLLREAVCVPLSSFEKDAIMNSPATKSSAASWGAHRLEAVDAHTPVMANSPWGAGPSQEIIAPWKAREAEGSWISGPGARLQPNLANEAKPAQWEPEDYLARLQASRAKNAAMGAAKGMDEKARRNPRGLGA